MNRRPELEFGTPIRWIVTNQGKKWLPGFPPLRGIEDERLPAPAKAAAGWAADFFSGGHYGFGDFSSFGICVTGSPSPEWAMKPSYLPWEG
jgi:hypothetical protein